MVLCQEEPEQYAFVHVSTLITGPSSQLTPRARIVSGQGRSFSLWRNLFFWSAPLSLKSGRDKIAAGHLAQSVLNSCRAQAHKM
jgi:hypothetical protein